MEVALEEKAGAPSRVVPSVAQGAAVARPAVARHLDTLSFATAPAFFASGCLCLGILTGTHFWFSPGLLFIGAITLACLALIPGRPGLLALIFVWVLLGAFLIETEPAPLQHTPLTLIAEADGLKTIEGVVTRTTAVRFNEKGEATESVDLQVPGGLRATIYGSQRQPLQCGDRIRAAIAMRLPERYLDPGAWDATKWLRLQGVEAIGSIKASAIEVTGHDPPRFSCKLHALQQAGSQRLMDFAGNSRILSTADAGMLSAMILGDRTYLNREERVGFERTGSFHLLVVSGMHLAIFAGCIFALARWLRLGRPWSTTLTILCSFFYALLAGFGEPVQRSFWMVTLYLLARVLFRQRNSLNAIGFAALCLLAFDPRALLGASFQMTLLSVLIVAGVAVPLIEHSFGPYLEGARQLGLKALDPNLPPKIAQFRVSLRLASSHLKPFLGWRLGYFLPAATVRFVLRCAELLVVSCLIEMAMSLPMAVYFHRVTALGLPVNLVVVPLIGLVLPAAFITFAVLLIAPHLAVAPALVTGGLLHAINAIVGLFSHMRAGDLRIPGPGPAIVTASILLIAAAIWSARNSRFPRTAPVAALACSAALVFYPRTLDYHPGLLEVTAIDVGQGDSLLLVFPEGKTLLVDAGGPTGGSAQTGNFEIGEEVVSPFLWSRGIRRLDAVALTHAHSDHMGGMPAVLRNFRPQVLWVGTNPETSAYESLLAEAAQLRIPVESMAAGSSFAFGGTQVEVLAPPVDYLPGDAASNDDSLVLHITYEKTSVLLDGDAQAASERQMLGEPLRADLLKIGHHGSRTSTTAAFLAAVQPSYAVISVARHNPYGHPKLEVLERLQRGHIPTYRTDAVGATSFFLDGSTIRAEVVPR